MGRVMQIAAFSLAEVTYAVGGVNLSYQIQESAKSAKFRVRTKQENVSGVFLPAFEAFQTEGGSDFQLTGLGKGGQQVSRCRETYARAVETLVELASLQTAFVILDEVIKVVNRRVNAMFVANLSPRFATFTDILTANTLLYRELKTQSNISTANLTSSTEKSSTVSKRSRARRSVMQWPRRRNVKLRRLHWIPRRWRRRLEASKRTRTCWATRIMKM
jgi:hypothetical protein